METLASGRSAWYTDKHMKKSGEDKNSIKSKFKWCNGTLSNIKKTYIHVYNGNDE